MKKILFLLIIAWMWLFYNVGVINKSGGDTFSSGNEDSKSLDERQVIQGELLDKDTKKIRVLLTDNVSQSYYHPFVTVKYNGQEETYTLESDSLQNGTVILECDDEGITISSIQKQQGNPTYQGTLEIRKTKQGLLLINELPVETYLEAVVPSEMPSSYEMEALKAQAVCARTYAYKQIEKQSLSVYHADVDDTVNYQVYENLMRQDRTNEAVSATEGMVLYQEDELIEAYYFSTSSGMTSTDEIWGEQEAASYLKSIECEFDSEEVWSNWYVTIPWERIADQEVKNLQINRVSQSGAVTGIKVITEAGGYEVSGEYAVREFLAPQGCIIEGKHGEKLQGGILLPSAYFDMKVIAGEYLKIWGRGYGHGVGMSQNAADEMAKKGYTWDEILEYFYHDVEVKKYI